MFVISFSTFAFRPSSYLSRAVAFLHLLPRGGEILRNSQEKCSMFTNYTQGYYTFGYNFMF